MSYGETRMSTTEEFYATIDFQSDCPDLSKPYTLIGLETDHPVLRLDRQVYRGTWATTVGTEMIFDEKGEWVRNVERRLLMNKVEVIKKGAPITKPKLVRLEDLEERKMTDSRETASGVEDQSMEPLGATTIVSHQQTDDQVDAQTEKDIVMPDRTGPEAV